MTVDLSIVMATAQDFDGVYFTVQALRAYQDLTNVEIIVVDNKPNSKAGERLYSDFKAGKYSRGTAGTKYIAMPSPEGTAAPRERAIKEASGKYVLCIDSHILLPDPNTISALIKWFKNHPGCKDILTGPIVLDDLENQSTHFNPFWRGEMWGIWGNAWQYKGINFSVLDEGGKTRFIAMDAGNELKTVEVADLPQFDFPGHENKLRQYGAIELAKATNYTDEGFEVPGNGLGLFAFAKEAWQGFNPMFSGFGGEELYIHQKFRNAGGICRCLSFLKWLHRFGRPDGVPYRLTNFDKCRNYIIGHNELGLSLDPVYDHFVKTGKIPQKMWDNIVAHPEIDKEIQVAADTLATLHEGKKGDPHSYFSRHADKLKEFAEKSETITCLTRFAEPVVHLLAGRPKTMHNFVFEATDSPIYTLLENTAKAEKIEFTQVKMNGWQELNIPESDLVFFKTPHCHETLTEDLKRFEPQCKRFIILHDVHRNGERLDNGKIGYLPQIIAFVQEFPKWFPVYHATEQTGLIVLGCQEQDRPAEEITILKPSVGVGTQLKELLAGLGINPASGCSCRKMAAHMDMVGVDKCEEDLDAIVEQIQKNYQGWGWKDKIKLFAAGALSITSGTVWELEDKTDPVRSMVKLAIKKERERLANLK